MANKLWNNYTDVLGLTVFHPQFLINRYKEDALQLALSRIKKVTHPLTLDIGCGRMTYRKRFETDGGLYFGLDHPAMSKKYPSDKTPEFLEDITKRTTLKKDQYDLVLFLHVTEYLDTPEAALREVYRVLKQKGYLVIASPFMYPVHDYPYDKNRFTATKLRELAHSSGLRVTKVVSQGSLFDVIVLFMLIACYKNIQQLFESNQILWKFFGILLLSVATLFTVVLNSVALFLHLVVSENKGSYPINITMLAQKR